MVVKDTFETMDIFHKREWNWLERYLGKGLESFDFEPIHRSGKHLAMIRAERKLPENLHYRLKGAAKRLKCEKRGVSFRLGKCICYGESIRLPFTIEFTARRTGRVVNARDFRHLALEHVVWSTFEEE